MTVGFTPPPWNISDSGFSVYAQSNRPWIAMTAEGRSDEERKANARLIAAAPELRAALVRARAIIQDERDTMVECATVPPEHDLATLDAETKPYVEAYDAALAEIDAVLARVGGEQ